MSSDFKRLIDSGACIGGLTAALTALLIMDGFDKKDVAEHIVSKMEGKYEYASVRVLIEELKKKYNL